MKYYVYLLLCLLLASCGQGPDKKQVQKQLAKKIDDSTIIVPTPSSVAEIKQAYAVIQDKLLHGLLDSVSYQYNCENETSGIVTYFTEKGKLTVIKHSYNEYDHFTAVDHYFVNDDNLFFAHFNQVLWSFESGQAAEAATKDDITEKRFYIAEKKPILCLEKKYTKRSQVANNPHPEDVPNKEIACQPIDPVLKNFGKLLAFKDSAVHDCLGKL